MANCGPGTFEMVFNASSPEAVAWAEANAARLIREVGAETRAAVRAIIARAFSEGIPPRQAARLVRDVVGLTSRQANAVANLRARLVARGRLSAAQIERRTTAYAKKLHRLRALTIARTESMRAGNEGQRQLWQQAKAAGYVDDTDVRQFVVTPDERLCPVCAPLAKATAPIETDTWTLTDGSTYEGSLPLHPNCRCTAVLVPKPTQEARRRRAKKRADQAALLAAYDEQMQRERDELAAADAARKVH